MPSPPMHIGGKIIFHSGLIIRPVIRPAGRPLTLTLSRREREQPFASFLKSASHPPTDSLGFAKTLGAFLPLPQGE